MPRIVSILPAATEILAQLDAIDMIVGRSHECDWPIEQVTDIEILTKPNFTSSRSSRDIHEQVLSQTESDLFSLDLEKLAYLAPDLILTQSACHVCAVDVNTVNRAVDLIQQKKGFRSKVLAFSPQSIDDVFHDVFISLIKSRYNLFRFILSVNTGCDDRNIMKDVINRLW